MEFKLKNITKVFFISLIILCNINHAFSQTDEQITFKYNKATQLIKELNWFEAKDLLLEIKEEKESYAPAIYQLGLIETHFKDYEKAINYFDKVIAINKDHVTDSYFQIGKIKWSFKDFKGAETALNHVIEHDKTNSEAFYLRGKMNYDKGEFESSSNDFELAILYNNEDIMYYFDRSLARIELQKYTGAIEDLTKVIAANPEMADAYFNRANAYYLEGSSPNYNHHHHLFILALEDYNEALKLDPELEPAYFNRGETHMRLAEEITGKKHETIALKEFEEITVIDPDYTDAYYDIAVINYEFGNSKKALEIFNQLIAKERAHDDAFLYRGYTYLELDDVDNACLDFEKADELGNKEAHKDIHKYCKSSKKKKKK